MKQLAKDIPTRKEWTRILAKTIACKAFLLDHASDSSMPNLIRKPTGVQSDESMCRKRFHVFQRWESKLGGVCMQSLEAKR
jgi:hypothetical protein